jgi:hypothetical protein
MIRVARRRLGLAGALLASLTTLINCGRVPDCADVKTCRDVLSQRSQAEAAKLKPGKPGAQRIAIIGSGIAGASAILNLQTTDVRIYGNPSFWDTMVGLPSVWQTNLDSFEDADLIVPTQSPGARIPRDQIILANLEALVHAKAAYLETGPVTVSERGGDWVVTAPDGRVEQISDALIVATGLLRPKRITDVLAEGVDETRRQLLLDGRIISGDQCLASSAPLSQFDRIGVIGAGGNAADCISHLLTLRSRRIVVWGNAPPAFTTTAAYAGFEKQHAANICHVANPIRKVEYKSPHVTINGGTETCATGGTDSPVGDIEAVVESLGRYEGEPPGAVTSAAGSHTIIYKPIIDKDDNTLIAVRVMFDGVKTPPLYLIGAAASWIPPGVWITGTDWDGYKRARDKTVTLVNPNHPVGRNDPTESAPPSFAVASYMGRKLAILLRSGTYP